MPPGPRIGTPVAAATAALLLALGSLARAEAEAAVAPRVAIRGGTYRSFYRGTEARPKPLTVRPFTLDALPVTNAEFHAFVAAEPRWQRDRVARVLADAEYLAHWGADGAPRAGTERQPVTRVSWFAARAHCASRGGRLPTESEWEYVARADERRRDATSSREFIQRILAWYSRPTPDVLANVGASTANAWGVHDLHGLVWEWVEDFGSSMVNVDSRSRGDGELEKFCGGSALGATDTANYASFMRYAFRSSLRGSYTLRNLGFRCAYDQETPP